MIRLTDTDARTGRPIPVYIAPEHVRVVQPDNENPKRTRVYFGDQNYRTVLEPPEEVARKVLDYRLFMEQYKASHNRGRPEDAKYALWDLLNFLEKEKSTAGTVE